MKKYRPGMFGQTERIHFVGIGGIGMSGLAVIMHNLSFRVTGSDLQPSPVTQGLKRAGIRVVYGHRAENVKAADVVVYSSAIRPDNPEMTSAARAGIPLIHRAELLAELTRTKFAICVSGTHGKTTTTSMIDEVLLRAGLAPTSVIGGIVIGKSQAALGAGDYLVCEVDESDKSFLRVYPSFAVITNIEAEHLDYYKDLDEIKEHFVHFANHVPFWGCVFLGADAPANAAIRPLIRRRVIPYGLDPEARLHAHGIEKVDFGAGFRVKLGRRAVGRFRINRPGRHNVANALAAIGVGLELGIAPAMIREALESFKGVHRRMEFIGRVNDISIFDDYGHHPTEIAVTLSTLREYYPDRCIFTVFQPHRYTRTYHLFEQFATSFLNADRVLMTEIYAAHEPPIPGITGRALARRVAREQDGVSFLGGFEQIIEHLLKDLRPGDIVIIQGAGDINQVAHRLLKELK